MSKLLDFLIQERLITIEQLKEAKDKQAGVKKTLQELLVELGFITEDELIKVSSKVFNIPIYRFEQ